MNLIFVLPIDFGAKIEFYRMTDDTIELMEHAPFIEPLVPHYYGIQIKEEKSN
jgi:hypothetical protein